MKELQKLRKQIDRIDTKIADLLKKRFFKTKKIGEIKKQLNLPIINNKREKQILEKTDTEEEKQVFKKIIEQSRKIQE
jgi:monofunctional chorismate mutase